MSLSYASQMLQDPQVRHLLLKGDERLDTCTEELHGPCPASRSAAARQAGAAPNQAFPDLGMCQSPAMDLPDPDLQSLMPWPSGDYENLGPASHPERAALPSAEQGPALHA